MLTLVLWPSILTIVNAYNFTQHFINYVAQIQNINNTSFTFENNECLITTTPLHGPKLFFFLKNYKEDNLFPIGVGIENNLWVMSIDISTIIFKKIVWWHP